MFNKPIPIPAPLSQPFTSTATTLADGHLQLSAVVASMCGGSSIQDLAKQRKLVFAYQETGKAQHVTFSLCPRSSSLKLLLWFVKCRNKLADSAGGDVDTAGCSCEVPDNTRPCCTLSPNGQQVSATTAQGYWVSAVLYKLFDIQLKFGLLSHLLLTHLSRPLASAAVLSCCTVCQPGRR